MPSALQLSVLGKNLVDYTENVFGALRVIGFTLAAFFRVFCKINSGE